MNINKLLKIVLTFTLLLVVSASGFYYPMFKEAIGVLPEMSETKKIKACKDSEQIQCWKKVINDNMKKDFFFPTKQGLVMNYFLFVQYKVQKIDNKEKQQEFLKEALGSMSSVLSELDIELEKEIQKPFSKRDLFIPFSLFYRYAQLSLAKDTIELTREKIFSYYKNYNIQ